MSYSIFKDQFYRAGDGLLSRHAPSKIEQNINKEDLAVVKRVLSRIEANLLELSENLRD